MGWVGLALVVVLAAGCSSDGVGAVVSPIPGSAPAGRPRWPAEGCDVRSMVVSEYSNNATGAPTMEEAAASYLEDGDRLVLEPPQGRHRARGWMVVTEDDEIRAVLGFLSVRDGYVVESAEECAGGAADYPDDGGVRAGRVGTGQA